MTHKNMRENLFLIDLQQNTADHRVYNKSKSFCDYFDMISRICRIKYLRK